VTSYLNSASLEATVDRIETTHFGSTGAESIAGDTTYTVPLAGDWDLALDTALAPEVITTGTKRNFVLTFVGSTGSAIYTWTSNAEVGDYKVSSDATGKITFSATISLSGAPVRTTA
jgi:hypothetical protein